MLSLQKQQEVEQASGAEKWLYRYLVALDSNEHLMSQLSTLAKYALKAEQHLLPEEFGTERYRKMLSEHRQRLMDKIENTEDMYKQIESVLEGLTKREYDFAELLYIDGLTFSAVREQLECSYKTAWSMRQRIIKYAEEEIKQ